MSRTEKREREREILDAVYSERKFEIEDSESPDFVVVLPGSVAKFGIEVTEFFESESDARMKYLPGYLDHLLDGFGFKHKDDHKALKVAKVDIVSKQDNTVVNSGIPAVIQELQPLEVVAARLADLIMSKNALLQSAFTSLHHINLIVAHRSSRLAHLEADSFYRQFCTERLREAIRQSSFREIFFITKFSSGSMYVPLKMLFGLAQLHLFAAAFEPKEPLDNGEAIRHFMWSFGVYLQSIVSNGVRIVVGGRKSTVLYGDSGYSVSKGGSVSIQQYWDSRFPESDAMERNDLSKIDPDVIVRMRTVEQQKTFAAAIAFAVTTESHNAVPNGSS